jgi:parallel beta-helix repeat protein
MKKHTTFMVACCLALATGAAYGQGSLTPPGAPAPTMKTLDQMEARTPISQAGTVITSTGSYYLTSDLAGSGTEHGIAVAADNVTIDLNGFTLTGPGTSSGHGIYQSTTYRNLTVINGKLINWGGNGKGGIYAAGHSGRIHGVQASGNYYGIYAGYGYTISDCTTSLNTDDGIYTAYECTIRNCTSAFNDDNGIHVRYNSRLSGCTTRANANDGIVAEFGCTVGDCTARANGDDGFSVSSGCMITGCTARDNVDDGMDVRYGSTVIGCMATHNKGDGILTASDCRVTDSTCDSNGTEGGGAGNRIEGNNVTDNDRGIDIDGTKNYVAHNTVSGNTDNYDIAVGNHLNLLLCEIPETIDWPCSVKLAGSLVCADDINNGITINTNDVTIDLCGHALTGPGGEWSGHGIYQPSSCRNLTVINGKMVNWSGGDSSGISARGDSCQIQSVQGSNNGEAGISAGPNSTISDCTAFDNVGNGIYAGTGCTIRGCSASSNADNGILAESGSTISDCTAANNTNAGIRAGFGCTISDCTARANDDGFLALDSSTISGCSAYENDGLGINTGAGSIVRSCTAGKNGRVGIYTSISCRVIGSHCYENGNDHSEGAGIFASSGSHIEGNTVAYNKRGIYTTSGTSGIFIVRNTAEGNTTNYDTLGANTIGPIITATGTITSTSPWANFEL